MLPFFPFGNSGLLPLKRHWVQTGMLIAPERRFLFNFFVLWSGYEVSECDYDPDEILG